MCSLQSDVGIVSIELGWKLASQIFWTIIKGNGGMNCDLNLTKP